MPLNKLEITFSRSSGPGGQNVNKVNTKADIRFHVSSADWLAEDVKKRLFDRYHSHINKEGFLISVSQSTVHLGVPQPELES